MLHLTNASDRLLTIPEGGIALVTGATGGIGNAVAEQLHRGERFGLVMKAGRGGPYPFDLTDEASIAALADSVKQTGKPLRLVFDATGYLHGDHGSPEKSWTALDANALAHQFAINTIGPALLMKHLLPLLPREGKAVFATISAKVGSITDNQLGGWYGYRAAKAGLNQIVKTASIEMARKRAEAICLALHPGTVATPLSAPFAKSGLMLQEPKQSATAMLKVIDAVDPAHSGALIAYDGTILPY